MLSSLIAGHGMKIRLTMGLVLTVLLLAMNAQAVEQYLTPEQFLRDATTNEELKPEVLWLTRDISQQAEKILGHAPFQLRQRYWRIGDKTVWVFDEIGKEEPITAGFIVAAGKISQVRILAYRESRGSEIKYPAFLKQYQGVELSPDNYLNRNIDGISGATLSVNAVNRMVRLALYFDRISRQESH